MKVILKTNMLWPPGSTTPAGEIVVLSEEMADDWIERGLAEPVTPAPEPVHARPAPEPAKAHPKGKK